PSIHMGGAGSGMGYGGLGTRGYGRGGGGRASIRMGQASRLGMAPLRKTFDQTSTFFPEVRTGPDGVASVTFRLPDSITSWKVTARGVTRDTQLGEETTELIATQEFWAELVVPPELEEGDRLQPLARLFNESKKDLSVKLELTVAGRKISRQAKVAAAQTAEVLFDSLEIPDSAPGAKLELLLTADAGDLADRLLRKLPVRPRGIREDVSVSGRLTRSATRILTLDKEIGDLELLIRLDPRMTHLFLAGRLDPVLFNDRPEEALAALNILELLDPKADQAMLSMVRARLRRALVHLLLVQRADGGWGWGQGSSSTSLIITARAIRALARAKPLAGQLSWSFPQASYGRALTIVKNGLPGLPPDDFMQRAAILYALAHEGKEHVPVVHLHRLHRLRNTLPLGAQALLGLTWHALKRPEKAAEVAKSLMAKVRFNVPCPRAYAWLPTWGAEPADLARALELLALTRPNDPLVKKGAEWLLDQGEAVGFRFPREAEAVSAALRRLLGAEKSGQRYRVKVAVNGQQVKTVQISGQAGNPTEQVNVAAQVLRPGENKIELSLEGSGSCFFTATLSGYRKKAKENTKNDPIKLSRTIEPVPLPYKGHDINAGFSVLAPGEETWVNKIDHIPATRRIKVTLKIQRDFAPRIDHCVLSDRLPPGFELVPGSLSGNHSHMQQAGRQLVFFMASAGYHQQVQYQLQAINPGVYQFPPLRLVSLANPKTRVVSDSTAFTIDGASATLDDVRPTPDELYLVGLAAAEEKDAELCILKLESLNNHYKLNENIARNVLAKLLFASIDKNDQQRIVKYFELAKEKNPDLVIPFAKIAPVQAAYRTVKAYEAGLLLARGVAEARFMSEVHNVGILETEDEMAEAIAMLKEQLNSYPDNRPAAQATYAFSQVVFARADQARQGDKPEGFDRPGLLEEVIWLMARYLGYFPTDPQGPPAIYSLASALLERGRAGQAAEWCDTGLKRHPESDLAPAMAYLKAFAHFKLGQYGPSLKLCQQVAKDSPDEESREMARYIMAQIHHSRGQMSQALALYRQVQDRFRDAWETIRESERQLLVVPEIVSVAAGQRPILTMTMRNLERINLRAYRVDPMRLYQLKGSLSDLTEINLAGIRPVLNQTIRYPKQIGVTREIKHKLRLPGKGAYLLLVRGGHQLLYSLALNGSLATDVTEDHDEGRVRVTVRTNRGKPISGARVQLKGSDDDRFIAGKTDLRGIFIAENIMGTVTVIAQHNGSFGLYRGTEGSEDDLDGKDRPPQPAPKYKKKTVIDFDDDVIDGELLKPTDESMNFFQKRVKGMSVEQAK
ncbi:MAG: hypothetical protein JRJ19_02630, partial [Deltaproteobacteria bacterium]|nr:hypothetical protein [Deltaproteobacteria bacterium]